MPDDEEHETQWTDAARDHYRAAARAAVVALSEHADREPTWGPGPADRAAQQSSAAALRRALAAFAEAEFDLTGSLPFSGDDLDDALDDGEPDEDFAEEFEGDDAGASGFVIIEHRVQLAVLDELELIAAARDAYLTLWPATREADAEVAVAGVSAAVGELLHANGWDALMAGTDYLEPRSGEISIVEVDDLPGWIPSVP